MALKAGEKLGPYEIVSLLGAGGMGEVYRAKDTKLGREVALKVLPEKFFEEKESIARFEREAKSLAAVSHSNIAALYSFEEISGRHLLVMELADGQTLAERLLKGPLALDQLLKTAIEIASALAAAHRVGIVHRDLKPGNVMLTKSGVKLLDFGLAKTAVSPVQPSELTSQPTELPENLTQKGTILGTFQYMAPEQLEGKEADPRSDIFAFGAVLYEMAAGRKAFEAKSQASLISAIMSSDPPPVSTLQPMTPPALDRVVRTCLAKDPEERWESAGDVAKELSWIAEGPPAGAAAPMVTRRGRRRERVAWVVAGLLALGTLYLAHGLRQLRMVRSPATHYFLIPPEGTDFRLTGDDGGPIALSPDGERIVFAAGEKLWVRSLRSGTVTPLAATDGGKFPFWSPDSRSIGFFSDGKLRVIEVSGGPVQTICDAPNARGGTWSASGVIVFAPDVRAGLQRVASSGGAPTSLTRFDEKLHSTHRWPSFLPDGKHFLYLAANHQNPHSDQSGIYVASTDGTENRRLLTSYGSAQYASGWLLSVRGTSLVGQRFDPATLALSGQPVRVADDVNFDEGVWRGTFTASENGILAFELGQAGGGGQLTWLDTSGRRLATVGERSVAYSLRLSPDGRRALAILGDPNNDIWVYELERGVRIRLTRDAQVIMSPQWSPDGSQILFGAQQGPNQFTFATVLANGAGEKTVLYQSEERIEPTDWSRDGRYVLVDRGNIGAVDVWAIPLADPAGAFRLIQTPSYRTGGQFSPDGRWVAFNSRESGRTEVYVTSFSERGARWQVSASGGTQPRWRRDGQELYFVGADGELMSAAVDCRGPRFEVRDVKPLFRVSMFAGPRLGAHAYDVAPDGKRFLVNAAGESGAARVALVVHWDADLPK
ncbi:MAG: protein kinase [Thermoanaerobaculia bacterium]